jgi:pimeloyl-ACP methyl ester carboxylesterase
MKHISILMVVILLGFEALGQSIVGKWMGKLQVMGTELGIVFNVSKEDDGYSTTLDSPDQGTYGISVDSTAFNESQIYFSISSIGAYYEGTITDIETIDGKFMQAGMEFDLILSKSEEEEEKIKRPQEPENPLPYVSEEVTFSNEEDGITLVGTFTYPSEGEIFPAVVLISGSGPQNRDEEIFNHKPFLVLSDHLTKQGIAVLRYDERGVGESTGDFSIATTSDLARDTEAAVQYLLQREEVDRSSVGLVGHSEGGIIAPLVASRNSNINMIVLLAGTAVRGDKLLNMQRAALLEASGISGDRIKAINEFYEPIYKIMMEMEDLQLTRDSVFSYLEHELEQNPHANIITNGMKKEQYIKALDKQLLTRWMINFIKYDPAPVLEKVKCPVLALIGSKDMQVPVDPNLNEIRAQLEKGGNRDFLTKEIPDVNHMFQTCSAGLPNEYWQIEETFAPAALKEISDWLIEKSSR